MAITSIKGTLAPTNPQNIVKAASKISSAANTSLLSGVIKPSPAWNHGIIVINSGSETILTGLDFISRLREFIHTEGVQELGLQGTLTVKVDTKMNDFKVTVEAGTISSEEVKFSHLMMPNKAALNPILYMQ